MVRFIPYEVNRKKGTILQTVVRSGIVNNTLPIEQTNMVIEVPVINGKMPKDVRVTALGVLATNGKTAIREEEWNYDAKKGIVVIGLKNEAVEGKVAWTKQGQDELMITYLYDEKVDTVETLAKVSASIKAYNTVETKIPLSHELTISQNEALGKMMESTVQTTESISKGYLYHKVQKEMEYIEQVITDIAYPELVDSITLTQDMDYFVDEEGRIGPTTIGNTNYAYYKTTKINAQNFKEILGEEGSIRILTLAGEELGVWNKDTIVDENGDYVLHYETETNQIKMITSKPVAIGKLVIKHEKALKGNTAYAKEQIETFKTLKTKVQLEAKANTQQVTNETVQSKQQIAKANTQQATNEIVQSKQQIAKANTQQATNRTIQNEQQTKEQDKQTEVTILTGEAQKDITLVEPTTKIETSVGNANLSTVVKNENVELRVILKTNDITCDLYKNPKIQIVLPLYIEKIEIKDINLLFDEQLSIKNYRTSVNERGNTIIDVEIEGEQTTYSSDEITKGANLIINTDITLKQLTPTIEDVMKVYVTNELVTSYEQVETPEQQVTKMRVQQSQIVNTDQKGYSQTILKAVAPVGMLTTTSISNYNAKNETITSIGSEEKIGKLDAKKEAKTANVHMNIINNYQNSVSQMVVLGRIPTKGSTNADTLQNFNSNLALTMASGITIQIKVPETTNSGNGTGVSIAELGNTMIYYSENPAATKDITLATNGWTLAKDVQDYGRVKSYMIVFGEEITTGTTMEMNYQLQIPENVSYNMGAYSNYAVYFNNQTKEGNVSEKTVSAKVGLQTGEGPELEVKLLSDKEGKEVQEGEIITYTIRVKNIGKSEVKNATISGTVPGKTRYTYIADIEGEGATTERKYDTQKKEHSEFIETIGVGETKTITYQVETKDLIVGYDENDNVTKVEDYTIQNSAKVKVEGYDGEFASNRLDNKLIQGYLNVEMKVATLPAEYVRKEGDEITYIISVKNNNGVEKKNLQIKIDLPQGLRFKEADKSGKYDEKTRQLQWNISNLEGNANERYEFTAVVGQLKKDIYEEVIKTKASIVGEKTVETNEIEITVKKPKLTISQTTEITSPVPEGDTLIYHYEVKNEGKMTAYGVKLEMDIPEDLQYEGTQYSYGGKTYTSKLGTGKKAEVGIGSLEPEETLTVSIKTTVKELEDGVEKKQIVSKATVLADTVDTITSNEITHTIVVRDHHAEKDPSTGGNVEKGTHTISGIAWLDTNGDGKRDEEEQRMAGIPVILINADNGQIVKDITTGNEKKQQTNEKGEYYFANLRPGKYMVVFLYDSGNYGITRYKQEGINDNKNSDAVQMNVVYEGTKRVAGVSDKLMLDHNNISNIDIGLITSPKFDLKLDKVISKITVSDKEGTDVYDYQDKSVVKLDLNSKTAIGSTIMIEYKIKVTNEGGVAGYAKKIVDYMPNDMKFSSELNKDWYIGDNGANLYSTNLANTLIQPGETKEITLLLTKKMTNSNMGIINNTAEIAESSNDLGLADIDSTPGNKVQNEDDYGSADAIIGIKTGEIYMYIVLSITVISMLGAGIYFIKRKVLKKQ